MNLLQTTRRHFLGSGSLGLGALAAGLLNGPILANPDRKGGGDANDNPLSPKKPHFEPKAKRVIYLHMSRCAAASRHLFDYKPELVKRSGRGGARTRYLKGRRFAFTTGVPKLMGTPRTFAR